MATKFKVPKSPKKSIFEIDQFLGVDLTNSGTNIDERHSPNAPNMTRLVPSKVRKRTGYQDQVIFNDGTDVNRALSTSGEWEEYTEDLDTGITFNLAEEIPAGTVFTLFVSLYSDKGLRVKLEGSEGVVMTCSQRAVDKVEFYWPNKTTANKPINKVTVFTESDSEVIKIKGLYFVYGELSDGWETPWTPAPEDNGVKFIKTESTEPVYGCHVFHSNNSDGDFVTNVNRALNTISSSVRITQTTVITEIADSIPKGVTVNIDFDAISDGGFQIELLGQTVSVSTTTTKTHFSLPLTTTQDTFYSSIKCSLNSGTYVELSNLSVTYAKDSHYEWTKAPEDKGEKFNLENLYSLSTTNYSTNEGESYSTTISSTTMAYKFVVAKDSELKGLTYLAFKLYTASPYTISQIIMRVYDSNNNSLFEKRTNAHYNNKKFELFFNADTYPVDNVEVSILFSDAGRTGTMSISDVEVRKAVKKAEYTSYSSYYIYHVGRNMYLAPNDNSNITTICTTANENVSKSWELNNSIYILDGKNIFVYDLTKDEVASIGDEVGYIPTVTIGKDPSGGGTPYDDLNLLQSGFYELFTVDATKHESGTKRFYLSFQHLDNDKEVKAWILQSDATWALKKEGTDFDVDRANGIIDFYNTIGVTPLTGEDNVKILAYRTIEGYADRIRKCTIGTLFGVNGAADRLFLSGNPDFPNYDWYSEQYNPTYFPDTGYAALGLETSSIVGYAIVNNYLATFKDENEPSQSVFIREGDLITNNDGIAQPQFKLINTLQGAGAIAKNSFGYLRTEPLFLTRSGIFAITAQDITGEKYGQNRSFYLNGALTEEVNLEKAYSIVFNDMYLLSINDKIYALDGLQAIQTDKSEPYATRQYVGFYWDNIPAVCLWTDKQALWFGTKDGHICRFATDVNELESYNDNGNPISCCWETPDLDGQLFYKNKSFRYIAIRMMSAIKTSAKLWSMSRGSWSLIKEDRNTGIYFDFESIDFESFTFSTDRTDKVAHSKIRVKKVDKARFKIENNNLNEPFGLMNLALEYVESGNYKG